MHNSHSKHRRERRAPATSRRRPSATPRRESTGAEDAGDGARPWPERTAAENAGDNSRLRLSVGAEDAGDRPTPVRGGNGGALSRANFPLVRFRAQAAATKEQHVYLFLSPIDVGFIWAKNSSGLWNGVLENLDAHEPLPLDGERRASGGRKVTRDFSL